MFHLIFHCQACWLISPVNFFLPCHTCICPLLGLEHFHQVITNVFIIFISQDLIEIPISPLQAFHFICWWRRDSRVQRQCKFTQLVIAVELEPKGSILCLASHSLWRVAPFAARFEIVYIVYHLSKGMSTWVNIRNREC